MKFKKPKKNDWCCTVFSDDYVRGIPVKKDHDDFIMTDQAFVKESFMH